MARAKLYLGQTFWYQTEPLVGSDGQPLRVPSITVELRESAELDAALLGEARALRRQAVPLGRDSNEFRVHFPWRDLEGVLAAYEGQEIAVVRTAGDRHRSFVRYLVSGVREVAGR